MITDYVAVQPVPDEDWPDAHRVVLKVDNQSFWIGTVCEVAVEAQFIRNMLCIALKAIVERENNVVARERGRIALIGALEEVTVARTLEEAQTIARRQLKEAGVYVP